MAGLFLRYIEFSWACLYLYITTLLIGSASSVNILHCSNISFLPMPDSMLSFFLSLSRSTAFEAFIWSITGSFLKSGRFASIRYSLASHLTIKPSSWRFESINLMLSPKLDIYYESSPITGIELNTHKLQKSGVPHRKCFSNVERAKCFYYTQPCRSMFLPTHCQREQASRYCRSRDIK